MNLTGHDYANWSDEELRRAESVAHRFLEDNGPQIHESFQAKVQQLQQLAQALRYQRMKLDERLECFARITEIARSLSEDAEGLFKLASEPLVARMLAKIGQKPEK